MVPVLKWEVAWELGKKGSARSQRASVAVILGGWSSGRTPSADEAPHLHMAQMFSEGVEIGGL